MSAKRTILWSVGVLVAASFAVGPGLRRHAREARSRDLVGAAVMRAEAALAAPIVRYSNQEGRPQKPWALVRFRDRVIPVEAIPADLNLPEGAHVLIEYRVGRSGRVVIDRVLGAAQTPLR